MSPVAADFPAETLGDTKCALATCTAWIEVASRGSAMPGSFSGQLFLVLRVVSLSSFYPILLIFILQ